MRPTLVAASSLLLLAALAPWTGVGAQGAEATPAKGTSLYLHLFNIQDMPMTPEAPAEGFATDIGFGAGTSSLSCFPNPPGTGLNTDYHTLYGYASPSPLEYDRGGDAEIHPDRGLLAGVSLDGSEPVLHWYWSTQAIGGPGGGILPIPLANVVVQATLRSGAAISIDDVAYNSGELLAQGRSAPATLAGPQSVGVEHSAVDGRHVYHFTVPLDVQAAAIPASGYNLRIDTYVLRDECPQDGGYVTPNVLAMHTSPGHRPRLELATVQQPQLATLGPVYDNGTVRIDVRAATAWGGVDIAHVEAEVVGPSEPQELAVEDYHLETHCHCDLFGANRGRGHDVRVTWDAAGEGAAPGDYTLRLVARNLQGNAEAALDVPFTVAGEQESPGALPMAGGLALLALAAVRKLQRRDQQG